MKKILLGGSPCTYWSVAQAAESRETKAEGLGWELFLNYLIAKEKFQPDFFLYENNKSAATAIKEQISKELGAELMYINSALVSAQNRERFYVFNWEAQQPQDRGIKLRDILESGEPYKQSKNEKGYCLDAHYWKTPGSPENFLEGKHARANRSMVIEPIQTNSEGKSRPIQASYGKYAASDSFKRTNPRTGVLVKVENEKAETITDRNGKTRKVYEVKNGFIKFREKLYPLQIPDGHYIIRKLTTIECERLQTVPDNYTVKARDTQRYKMLGNGWTAEVIIHLLQEGLKDVPRDEELVVLSMYDGMATGRYCLEQLGFKNIKYYAYEIDKPAISVALDNYPDIIEMGDAFQVRNDDWKLF